MLRDRAARAHEALFVAEGPRLLDAALAHRADVRAVYVGHDAGEAALDAASRAGEAGIDRRVLADGVADRVSDTRGSQGVFALVAPAGGGAEAVMARDLSVVCEHVADPGNAGTVWRSAAATGAGVVLGRGSVDAYNPKVVRASAGACFTCPIVEDVPVVEMLETLAASGSQRLAAVARGGRPPESFDLRGRTAFVLGHETRGLGDLDVDDVVTIPMADGESLNLAMAATALVVEAARQRRQP